MISFEKIKSTITILTIRKMRQLHRCSHTQRNMEENLMFVLNVGKDLPRKVPCKNICWFIMVIIHTLVLFVTTKLHTNTISNGTFAPTLVTNPTLVVTVNTNAHKKTVSLYTYAHTHGRNRTPVMCVVNLLRQVVIWNDINWHTQARRITNVISVVSYLVRRVA